MAAVRNQLNKILMRPEGWSRGLIMKSYGVVDQSQVQRYKIAGHPVKGNGQQTDRICPGQKPQSLP